MTNTPSPLHYTCTGSGPDVLLIHGWGSSGVMWGPTMQALAGQFRLWAVDLAGSGASQPYEGVSGINRHVEALAAFCERHQIKPLAVVGHSMGGMVALKLAAMYPDLMQGLVLVCPCITGRYGFPGMSRFFRTRWTTPLTARSQLLWRIAKHELVVQAATHLLFHPNRPLLMQIVRDFQRADWRSGVHDLHSMARENVLEAARQIRIPTLVIVGGRDRTVPPDEGRAAAFAIPKARLVEFPTCAHRLPDERPEAFFATLQNFLTR
ncbi:MAG: alpha/beta hydrolase [bacterium]|nr:alpha/beta hydrolase [bacterium]